MCTRSFSFRDRSPRFFTPVFRTGIPCISFFISIITIAVDGAINAPNTPRPYPRTGFCPIGIEILQSGRASQRLLVLFELLRVSQRLKKVNSFFMIRINSFKLTLRIFFFFSEIRYVNVLRYAKLTFHVKFLQIPSKSGNVLVLQWRVISFFFFLQTTFQSKILRHISSVSYFIITFCIKSVEIFLRFLNYLMVFEIF